MPSPAEVIYLENLDNLFHFYVYIPAGSIYEDERVAGGSHMLEHMLFRNKGVVADIPKALTALGGNYNAGTYKDVTFYYVQCHASVWEEAVVILHQITQKANFTQADLDVERKVVMEEYNQSMADEEAVSVAKLGLGTILKEDNPYLRPVIGELSVLKSITAEELKAYYASRYGVYKLVVNAPRALHKAVRDKIGLVFGVAKVAKEGEVTEVAKERELAELCGQVEPLIVVLHKPMVQYTTRLYFPGYPCKEVKKGLMVDFLSFVLAGAGLHSLLNHAIRVERGLVYTVQSAVEALAYHGYMVIEIASSNPETEYILSLVYDILGKMKKNGLSPGLLAYYKKSFLNATRVSLSKPVNRTDWYGTMAVYGARVDEEEYLKWIEAMTVGDVREAAVELFDFTRQGILSVGGYTAPKKTSKKILDLIHTYQ